MYAANVVGGVAGSLLAGFWWLPSHGAHATTVGLASLNVIAAGGLMAAAGRGRVALGMLGLGVALLAPGWLLTDRFDLYRAVLTSRLGSDTTVEWYDEGIETSVALAQRQAGERFVLINGSIHASTRGHRYHQRLGHVGPLVHPAPHDVLVIGLGGGTTAGTIALYPEPRVHVVELSAGVLEAARRLRDGNHDVLGNPRVTTSIDDGRNHLLVSGRRYDMIEADVLEPRKVGASVIYSREFFEIARRSLKPGGLMVQWLGTPAHLEYQWTLRTFAAVFPHVQLWMGGDVALGSDAPLPDPDRDRFERLRRTPRLGAALEHSGLASYEQVLALRVGRARPPVTGGVITDDRPSLEYFLTLPLLTRLCELWARGSPA
jgi:predicted membrane-bound spermidine synthase